jgi:ribosomal protein S6
MDENYNICMCDIDKICKFIKDKYGKDVRLVPKEDMGNKKLEKEIPDLVFEYDEIMKQEEISHQVPVYTDIFRIDEIKKEDETYGLEGLIVE